MERQIFANIIRGATGTIPAGGQDEITVSMPNTADMDIVAFNLTVDGHPLDAPGLVWDLNLQYLEVDKPFERTPAQPIRGPVAVRNLFGNGSEPGVVPHRIPIIKGSELKFSFVNRDVQNHTLNVTVYAGLVTYAGTKRRPVEIREEEMLEAGRH